MEEPDGLSGNRHKTLEKLLKEKIHSTLSGLRNGLEEKAIKYYENYLLNYPKFLSQKIKSGNVGPSTKSERKEKISQLEKIIKTLAEEVNEVDESCPEDRTIYSRRILQDDSLNEYKINIFDPLTDNDKKIIKMAKKVKMCWTSSEAKYLSKGMADDCRLNGATIVYSVEKGRKTAAVMRNFLCIDKKGRYYLFIDTIEGKDSEVSHHDITRWAKEYPGAIKLGVILSLYIADKVGLEYVAAGDDAVSNLFETLGAIKMRTAVGDFNKKIGFVPKTDPYEDDEDTVREYFFFSSKKSYSIILNPSLKNKESTNETYEYD